MATVFYATGRRKNATAKVWVTTGTGQITVNDKDIKEYFERELHVDQIVEPIEATTNTGRLDVNVTASGGGKTGQAGAIRMGIARALAKTDDNVRKILSRGGYLTRDSRMVERKKYGRMKARRRFQFSKR